MRKKVQYILSLGVMGVLAACTPEVVTQTGTDTIAFYVKTQPTVSEGSRALVDDTDGLLRLGLPLYVTDDTENSGISDKEVAYTANGLWKSDLEWSDRAYNFHAYIASPKQTATDTRGGVTVANSGKIVTVQQPTAYTPSDDVWADFLLSYRVSAEGAKKELVKLELERVTACVELYMAMSSNMTAVTVNRIEFRNVLTKAQYSLQYHAVPGDNDGIYGMKNIWNVIPDENSRKIYSYSPDGGLSLAGYDSSSDKFAAGYRQMRFLAIHQSLIDGAELYINYTTVEENNVNSTYESVFRLSDYTPQSWSRGHKIRYFIGIDSSIDLEGSIVPWKSVDYIETTLLPND